MAIMSQMTDTQKEKIFWVGFPTLCLIALSLAVISLLPKSREIIRNVVVSKSRVVLAKAEADLTGHGLRVAVVKVQTADTIALEIFENSSDQTKLKFVKRIVLPERKDAYFDFRGNATNLVVTDVDNDGVLEIVAPTFDENLIPRLNVYKFDSATGDFFKLGPESYRF
jgi:hypothetical protein